MPMINSRGGWLIYLFAGFIVSLMNIDMHEPPTFQLASTKASSAFQAPVVRSGLISGGFTKEVHSASAVELPDGDIGVFWYAGSREGSKDVAIYSRFLNTQMGKENTDSWSEIRQVIDRAETRDTVHRYIRKLGNPLVLYHQDKLWLFYVSVSVGGWANSSINLIQSSDNGQSWSKSKRLITSPFSNISTLVKQQAVIAEDGSILLPVYHEFMGKFSEILHIDPQGEVLDKYRINHGRQALQPMLIPQGKKEAIVFLRNVNKDETESNKILTSQTHDGGKTWQPLSNLELPNPNAAVNSVSLDKPSELLLVFNNDESDRSDMTLAYASNYQSGQLEQWQVLFEFEFKNRVEKYVHNPYSYPFLVKTREGDFHLFYTWKKTHIKHVFFNRAALIKMIAIEDDFNLQQQLAQN
jgi:predicted neuraminidase